MTYNIFLRSGITPSEISVHIRPSDSQTSRFLTPQLLLDKLWRIYSPFCSCSKSLEHLFNPLTSVYFSHYSVTSYSIHLAKGRGRQYPPPKKKSQIEKKMYVKQKKKIKFQYVYYINKIYFVRFRLQLCPPQTTHHY